MRKLFRKFITWALKDQNQDRGYDVADSPIAVSGRSGRLDNANGSLRFTVHRANNGYIVEINQYDHKSDRNSNSLHIINEDQELGQEIAHIITLESFKMVH